MSSKVEPVKVTGNCDALCGEAARFWYGNTSAATCGAQACLNHMDERYAEHCAAMEAEFQMERDMRAMYGDPDEY